MKLPKYIKKITILLLISVFLNVLVLSKVNAQEDTSFNYAEALQKSIYFYETQRSGELPEDNRVDWRGDSGLNDGADNNVDLTGGWYDAGDNVKFLFPAAYTVTMLSWGAYEYPEAYKESNQYEYILDNIKWGTDYILKSYPNENELYVQVGEGKIDHKYWVAAENSELLTGPRPSFKIDENCGGSDVAGEAAAALFSSYLVFKEVDTEYANILLENAKSLYSYAENYKGKYSDCITNGGFDQLYYESFSGYEDELAWGATWGYLATNDNFYLEKAKQYHESKLDKYTFTVNWDDKSYANHVLLAKITEEDKYKESAERWLNYWSKGTEDGKRITYSPGGLAWLLEWGALRFSANTSFASLVYSDWLKENNINSDLANTYYNFAESQLEYILGNNPDNFSYMVGYGEDYPKRAHHRTAHGGWEGTSKTPDVNRNIIYGALVGGPDANDNYEDNRSDYVKNEVALDYNAGLVGALARLYLDKGGEPLQDFPQPTAREDEVYSEVKVVNASDNRLELDMKVYNKTAWPARNYNDLTVNYYLNLNNISPEEIEVETYYNECTDVSQLKNFENNIYYFTVDCNNINIFPGKSDTYKKNISVGLVSNKPHSFENDYSYNNLVKNEYIKTDKVVVYSNNTKVYGQVPELIQTILGDVDNDGTVTLKDLKIFISYLFGSNDSYNMETMDIDENGSFNIVDLQKLTSLIYF